MEAVTPRILHLSEQVVSQIHSSKHISSLHGVVFALLENSLDAGSNKIEISLDWFRGGCVIKDDGLGISHVDFEFGGGLAQKYCTSKRQPAEESRGFSLDTHGTNGIFLAELASLSMLSITSKARDSDILATIKLHHGSVIDRQFGAPHDGNGPFYGSTEQYGTVVTVRDLFGSMPVRVKQRALAEPEEQKSWHELKRGVLALLLAWPNPCAVKLRDINSISRAVTLVSHRPGGSSELTRKNLSHLSGQGQAFDLRDVLSLLFQSGFASPESRSEWVPLSASTSALSLQGLICLDAVPTKECQFISIGIHPCNRNDGHHQLYEAVNTIIRDSDFGRIGHVESDSVGRMRRRTGENASTHVSRQRSARKGADRFAMFYLQIVLHNSTGCAADRIDNLSDALVAAIVNILEVAVSSWLEKNLFRPHKRRKLRNIGPVNTVEPNPDMSSAASKSLIHTQHRPRQLSGKTSTLPTMATVSPERGESRRSWRDDKNEVNPHSHIRTGSAYGKSHVPTQNPAHEKRASEWFRPTRDVVDSENGPPNQRLFEPPVIAAGTLYNANDTHSENVLKDPLFTPISPPPPKDILINPVWKVHPPDGMSTSSTSKDDFGSIDEDDMIAAEGIVNANRATLESDQSVLQWVDPVSRQTFRVDARTGLVLPPEIESPPGRRVIQSPGPKQQYALDTSLALSGNPLRLVHRFAQGSQENAIAVESQPKWLPDFLRSWKNPVFDVQSENPIPGTSLEQITSGPGIGQETVSQTEFGRLCSIDNVEKSITQLSRSALTSLKVIGQVDQKFILCTICSAVSPPVTGTSAREGSIDSEETLVLVDQHAASERVIVENLLRDYFTGIHVIPASRQGPSGFTLEKSSSDVHLQFNVTSREYDLFKLYGAHFAAWGIRYDNYEVPTHTITSATPKRPELRIIVKSLPSVIAERCINFPKLCIDLMRVEIWGLADGTRKQASSFPLQHAEAGIGGSMEIGEQPVWLKLVSACPQGILDMINSRACRSAIMFNDVLTIAQCRSLMKDLSACTFPFVCAHGRVSMVPLVQLDSAGFTRQECFSR